MLKQKIRVQFALLIFLASFLAACGGGSPEDLIVGRWESDEGTMEFFADGTAVLDDASVGGTYSIIDDTHLRLGNALSSFVMEFEVSRNKLVLIDGDERIEFTRAD